MYVALWNYINIIIINAKELGKFPHQTNLNVTTQTFHENVNVIFYCSKNTYRNELYFLKKLHHQCISNRWLCNVVNCMFIVVSVKKSRLSEKFVWRATDKEKDKRLSYDDCHNRLRWQNVCLITKNWLCFLKKVISFLDGMEF